MEEKERRRGVDKERRGRKAKVYEKRRGIRSVRDLTSKRAKSEKGYRRRRRRSGKGVEGVEGEGITIHSKVVERREEKYVRPGRKSSVERTEERSGKRIKGSKKRLGRKGRRVKRQKVGGEVAKENKKGLRRRTVEKKVVGSKISKGLTLHSKVRSGSGRKGSEEEGRSKLSEGVRKGRLGRGREGEGARRRAGQKGGGGVQWRRAASKEEADEKEEVKKEVQERRRKNMRSESKEAPEDLVRKMNVEKRGECIRKRKRKRRELDGRLVNIIK